MNSSMVRAIMSLLIFISLYCKAAYLPCEEEQIAQIEAIKNSIKTIMGKHNTACRSYGKLRLFGFPDHSNEIPRPLDQHMVCFENQNYEKIMFTFGTMWAKNYVSDKDIGKASEADKRTIRSYFQLCGVDHVGHIFPRELTGIGHIINLFAQDSTLNIGPWKTICDDAHDFLARSPHNRRVEMLVAFHYADGSGRPDGYWYIIQCVEDGIILEEHYGYFQNVNHQDLELYGCEDGKKIYHFLLPTPLHNLKKTCVPDHSKYRDFYPFNVGPKNEL